MTAVSLTSSQRILVVLALLMVLWYVVGTWYSRRKGIRTLNWLREGVGSLGGQLQATWIGSAASGARVNISKANPPFRQFEVAFLLESRELLPIWLMNLLRGRRDELIIKAELRSLRRGEMHAVPAGSRMERSLRRDTQSSWQWRAGPHGLHIAYRGRQGKALSTDVVPFLQSYGRRLRRLSWGRGKPHLLLKIRLAGLTDQMSTDFFTDLIAVFTHTRQATGNE